MDKYSIKESKRIPQIIIDYTQFKKALQMITK